MRAVTVTMNVSLDGVVQSLGRPDEDTRNGFTHGGWGTWHQDEALATEMGTAMGRPGDLLLGRRTWQDFIVSWAGRTDGNPYSELMSATTKYVASTTLDDVDGWQNSVLLRGEATRTVAELREHDGPDLAVIGSAALARSLHAAGLVDRYTLITHPLVLGSGARLFEGTMPMTRLTLTRSMTTPQGVIVAYYERR